MWAGALSPVLIPDLAGATLAAGQPALVAIPRAHTPALLKIVDEILVNATDQAAGGAGPGGRVTRIDVSFDPKQGRVEVFNDGPGIPVRVFGDLRHEGRPVYTPEVAFAYFLSGTNIEKGAHSIKGGMNGLGAKLANVHSAWFRVETLDTGSGLYYSQVFRDRLDVREPPQVLERAAAPGSKAPYTRVSFVPAYRELGYPAGADAPLTAAAAADLEAWIRLRALQTAAYLGTRRVAVSFNGRLCETSSAAALARLLLPPGVEAARTVVQVGRARAEAEGFRQHPWEVVAVVLPPGVRAARLPGGADMALVNGVLCRGAHVAYLRRTICAAVNERIRRVVRAKDSERLDTAAALAGVRLVMCGALPGADWGGQRKDELQVPPAALNHYKLDAAFLRAVGQIVAERVLVARAGKAGARAVPDKYTPARRAGGRQRAHARLLAAEGDSALSLLSTGLKLGRDVGQGGPSTEWCGVISLQGVVMNAARQVTQLATGDGQTVAVRSQRLRDNKRLSALATALGLRYDCTYETAAERAELNYGQLVLCVDQDVDGVGKIAPLVLTWVHTLWPALLRAGFVARFATPLVRAYPPRGAPVEFYDDAEFQAWLAAEPDRAARHDIRYYKGLASHDEGEETLSLFAAGRFEQNIHVYRCDPNTSRAFGVYFGASPALRKVALARPAALLGPGEAGRLRAERQIPVARVQLEIEAHAYKLDAIKRQIPGAVDGLTPSRRKILAGAFLRLRGHAVVKVFQLCGFVSEKLHYHHGNDPLNLTITWMAQAFLGARLYPFLTGVGQFGNRHEHLAGKPRYISVRLGPLAAAAFPAADACLLEYVFEDGARAEPVTFVPVAPLAVLESGNAVSEAWNHESLGRDLDAACAVVDAYLAGDPTLHELAGRLRAGPDPAALQAAGAAAERWDLPPGRRGFTGTFRAARGRLACFGAYHLDQGRRTVVVTELPIGVETKTYVERLTAEPKKRAGRADTAKKPTNPREALIERVADRSTVERVELHITLRAGALEQILRDFGDRDIDAVEDALNLYEYVASRLNFYAPEGGVLEFKDSYLAALLYWAPRRQALYVERVRRSLLIARLRLLEEQEILRFIPLEAEFDLAGATDEAAAARALSARGFMPLDTGLLHRPGFTPNARLEELVRHGPGAGFAHIL
ncbi:MAG TPA: DNA gyrase subunit A, partial [Elusimicrobiota bacterium]|nr:DNA gyrase subunit A [Elusimicrobiota bacterium]